MECGHIVNLGAFLLNTLSLEVKVQGRLIIQNETTCQNIPTNVCTL